MALFYVNLIKEIFSVLLPSPTIRNKALIIEKGSPYYMGRLKWRKSIKSFGLKLHPSPQKNWL